MYALVSDGLIASFLISAFLGDSLSADRPKELDLLSPQASVVEAVQPRGRSALCVGL